MVVTGSDEARRGMHPEETWGDLVSRLLQHESRRHIGGLDLPEATASLCLTMRPHLVDIMGTGGFRAMMVHARATALTAAAKGPSPSELVDVDNEGCLRVLIESALDSPHRALVVSILARFLGLLTDFIGHNLVLRMVHQAWPDFDILPPFSTRKREDK